RRHRRRPTGVDRPALGRRPRGCGAEARRRGGPGDRDDARRLRAVAPADVRCRNPAAAGLRAGRGIRVLEMPMRRALAASCAVLALSLAGVAPAAVTAPSETLTEAF